MIKKLISLILILVFINLGFCQVSFGSDVILENGTKIRLKLVDKVSSGLNQEGDEVNFTVAEDIKLGDLVLIKEGARATGIISELINRGRVGKAGKLTINLDYAKAVNGKKVPLNGTIVKKGEDKVFLSVGLAILLPVFPFGLMFRGYDATLPAGYQVQTRTDRDVKISVDDNFVRVNNKKLF
ncbi:MAG: hypothetical protein PHC34_01415 [Candidatus Gastranaerophilales bacterium]|nr:hypothetical protein [Candidatus Gastranaerophilales bacterium]